MGKGRDPVSFPEKDYLDILDVITKFNQCETRPDLKHTFQSQLLPLFEAQAGVYVWIDADIASAQILDSINIPKPNVKSFRDYLGYDNLGNSAISQGRSVVIYDAENNYLETKNAVNRFFNENPHHPRKEHSYLDRVEGALVTAELPDPNVGYAVHRLTPCNELWTTRDIRVFELLRPHLLQSIKTVVLREELGKYQSLAKKLADLPTPIAVVKDNTQIIFRNPAFDDILPGQAGQRLPEEIAHAMEREISKFDPPFDLADAKIDIPLVSLPQGLYRMSLDRLEDTSAGSGRLWLLRLKPALESFSKMNHRMQEETFA
ncbi:MAG: hypothetical protein ACE5E9_13190 [Nitrospinaceae bacterium]